MGRKGSTSTPNQKDGNLIPSKKASSKRKKLSPAGFDKSEKKTKHSDSESITSENWCDIDLPSDKECDQTIEMMDNSIDNTMSQSLINQTQVPENATMIQGNMYPSVATMSTPGHVNTSQMIFPPGMYGMPSPIVQQHPQSLSISDSDVIRIATLIKVMIKEDVSELVKQQVVIKTKELNGKIDKLKLDNTALKKSLGSLETKHDELEQYSRRTCVRIGNILEREGESTDALVLDVANKSGADISANDIDRTHRVGKHKDGKRREIMVKFVSYKARTKFLRSRKTLRENKAEIYLNEDLTSTRHELAYKCRELKKDKNSAIQSEWTFDGRQFIRTDKDVTIKIDNASELKPYTPKKTSSTDADASSDTE